MRATFSALTGLVTWLLAQLLLTVVRLYRRLLSPLITALFGQRCRFVPTCSEYALESLTRFGPVVGSWRAFRRVCRCHPFHPGGFDPVVGSAPLNGEVHHG